MDEGFVALVHRQHGILTRPQALELGFSRRQVEHRASTGEWETVAAGIYRLAVIPPSWHARLLAACFRFDALASHRSAATLHGIAGFRPGVPEIMVRRGLRRPVEGMRVHQTTQMDRAAPTVKAAVPCTGLARTVLDLAAVVDCPTLDSAIDGVLRGRRLDLPTLSQTLSQHARRGRDGSGKLRAALEDRLGELSVPLSDWSRMVTRLLVDNLLPAPVMEHRVTSSSGRFIAQVDLAYPAHRVAIELDSVGFHLNRASFEDDPARKNRVTAAGWSVLTFTWQRYVHDPIGLCQEVRSCLDLKIGG